MRIEDLGGLGIGVGGAGMEGWEDGSEVGEREWREYYVCDFDVRQVTQGGSAVLAEQRAEPQAP